MLFKVLSVDVPYAFVPLGQEEMRIQTQHIEYFPFMYWPNGRPCEPLNIYFLSIAHLTTGRSLETYASELSHLVRYCGKKATAFEDLTDSNIFELTESLQTERSQRNPTEKARNSNTVRKILSSVIRFLHWYQLNLIPPTQTPLIGEIEYAPQIIVARVENKNRKRRNSYYYTHRAMPTSVSSEAKPPISITMIEDIEKHVDLKHLQDTKNPTIQKGSANCQSLRNSQLEYLRVRRHFVIWIMKRTGLRPSEMVEINSERHADIINLKCIYIPTKKRRKIIAPERKFSITLRDAAVFHRYLIARAKYLKILGERGMSSTNINALLLGINGQSIRKTSLERDFSRLACAAGYKNVQACFSMFRHRFITYEVIVHLREFMGESGKTPHLMTNIDYESILKRVAEKTGHGDVQSLWHYIDLAWEEIDVWGGVERALDRLHAADRLFDELLSLKHTSETTSETQTSADLLKHLTGRLGEILSTARADLNREA